MSSSSDTPSTPSPTCNKCGKAESDLPQPLKHCAKCQTGRYCSRDCQKADWPAHKRVCASKAAAKTSESPVAARTNQPQPSKEEMIARATKAMALLNALTDDPNFNWQDITRAPKTLGYVFQFGRTTWDQYWCKLLAPSVYTEIRAGGNAEKKAFYVARDPNLRSEVWPPFNSETYFDCLTRGMMLRDIVKDPKKQAMFGGVYPFTQATNDAARQLDMLKDN